MFFNTEFQNIIKHAGVTLLFSALCFGLSSCGASGPKVSHVKKQRPLEYFAESDVGVKASPRPASVALSMVQGGKMKRLPRGGGRDMVGKPYKIRGKWYHPLEDKNYKANGTASWYGDAFHGRLTANGEIYDMNNLTAAHTTMPLPSYARVTNIKNGKSVIVRVNDRGPYASDRLVDLSKRAAQLLDYTHSGVAQVKLEYIGRAPVHGQDDEYLLSSYRENGAENANVMVAQNDVGTSQPQQDLSGVAFAPSETQPTPVENAFQSTTAFAEDEGVALEDRSLRGSLPAKAPTPINRPAACVSIEPCNETLGDGLLNGYAPAKHVAKKANAFDSLELNGNPSQKVKQASPQERILLGTFSPGQTKKLRTQLRGLGILSFDSSEETNRQVYAKPIKGQTMDGLVRKLWALGYKDAFVVR